MQAAFKGPEISIHALLAESDSITCKCRPAYRKFLSTLSLRRATCSMQAIFYQISISIHALLAESDCGDWKAYVRNSLFLSTLSLRRATSQCRTLASGMYDFYPRSPCGERPVTARIIDPTFGFLSTLSLRRATPRLSRVVPTPIFLSTLSLRRATSSLCFFWCRFCHFYPRSPCGERPAFDVLAVSAVLISIHALLAESDMIHLRLCNAKLNFYPRSPCGERPSSTQCRL